MLIRSEKTVDVQAWLDRVNGGRAPDFLLIELGFLRDHGDGLGGADADADAAAHAVERRHGHGVLVNALALAGLDVHDLGGGGSVLDFFLGQSEGTDGGVRADEGAVVALDALGLIPCGNGDGNTALLISGGITVLAAYALSKSSEVFVGRGVYLWVIVFTMLFNAGTIPWYMAIKNLGRLDTIWSLVLPCAFSAYNTILMMNFFKGIPPSLEESARVDGAGPWRTLFQIYIPLSKPSIATIALFIVVYHWNNFYDGLVLMSKPSHYPLQTYIYQLTVTIDARLISNIDALREQMKEKDVLGL